jgi:diguanylate cyclase (GGDEF)-like protein/PAS domain S-box-containing protein
VQTLASFRELSLLTALVSLLVAAVPPLSYFAFEYRFEQATVLSEAEINARLLSDLVNRNPEMWQFEQLRLVELLEKRPAAGNNVEIREIFGPSGKSIARSADLLAKPILSIGSPLFNAGRPVAELKISRSLQSAVRRSLVIALASIALGAMLYFSVATVPIRALRRAFVDLDEEKERALVTLHSIGDAVVATDAHGRILSLNPMAEILTGWTNEAAKGKPFESTFRIEREGTRAIAVNLVSDCLECNAIYTMENHFILVRKNDGAEFYIHQSAAPIRRSNGDVIGAVVVFRDNTKSNRAEEQLRIAAAAFESQQSMMVTDADGVIMRVNGAFTKCTGYTAEETVGQTARLLRSGRHNSDFYLEMEETIYSTGGWEGEVWDRRKNGEIYPKLLVISSVKDGDGVVTHYIGTHSDITERKKAEQKIEALAFFDQLTGLPNRTLLLDRVKQTMMASARSGTFGALLFIDLDHFKNLNDTLGHDKGDLLLQQVAQRLAANVREGDTVARLGGDEFVVVLGGLNVTLQEAATQVEAVGEKILAALNVVCQFLDGEYQSTASIGATLFKGHETSIDDLMKQADLAMYRSKKTGRNALSFFDPVMQTVVSERAASEASLRRALQENQFVLHYQAQVVQEGRITGAEALVRWQHPERGMVSPAEFIPLAEETGLILPLGSWVLTSACTQLARWAIRPEMAHLTVAVNVSAQEFRAPGYVDKVLATIRKTGANPNRLKLELTESLLIDNVEGVIEKMFALKAKGVGFSLDDFGTGYSSLSYLKRLPLDQLKIDQSFVRDLLTDPNDAAIVRTIVALGQSLGLAVIAEGVETEMQHAVLSRSDCHAYQGYLFSRPLPIDDFEEFVHVTGRL